MDSLSAKRGSIAVKLLELRSLPILVVPVTVSPISNATARRLRHAAGFLGLEMLIEASEELEAIQGEDRLSDNVLVVRSELYRQAKQWDLLVAVARELTRRSPVSTQGWLALADALREMNQVAKAKAALLEAEPIHGKKNAVLHFNLGRYCCLLGELDEAGERVRKACTMDAEFKTKALDEPDLRALWGDVKATK